MIFFSDKMKILVVKVQTIVEKTLIIRNVSFIDGIKGQIRNKEKEIIC